MGNIYNKIVVNFIKKIQFIFYFKMKSQRLTIETKNNKIKTQSLNLNAIKEKMYGY
jgi:hypothetical protein